MAIARAMRTTIFGTFLLLAGCSRKAPGPDACFAFALHALDIQDRQLLRVPRIKQEVDALTDKCLTTPFDRRLVQCVHGPRDIPACFANFERRHPRRIQQPGSL